MKTGQGALRPVREALRRAEGHEHDWRTRQLALEFKAALEGRVIDEPRFPFLARHVRPLTRPEQITGLLKDVGRDLGRPVGVVIGGSSALILQGMLKRSTSDVDVVDEVPAPLRELGQRLAQHQSQHRLELTHFQSHYLPPGWESRVHSWGEFGRLDVSLVDPLDIFVGKLMSRREKDREDLRYLYPQFDPERIKERMTCLERHLQDPDLREKADRNWYVLTGEPIPV